MCSFMFSVNGQGVRLADVPSLSPETRGMILAECTKYKISALPVLTLSDRRDIELLQTFDRLDGNIDKALMALVALSVAAFALLILAPGMSAGCWSSVGIMIAALGGIAAGWGFKSLDEQKRVDPLVSEELIEAMNQYLNKTYEYYMEHGARIQELLSNRLHQDGGAVEDAICEFGRVSKWYRAFAADGQLPNRGCSSSPLSEKDAQEANGGV